MKTENLPKPAPIAAAIEKNGTPVSKEGNLRSQWQDITPEMASRWLKNNFRNRPVSDDLVAAYARDIINGVWQPTHQGIAFNDRDELIDGQHRLMAIVRARKTVCIMVTFGLPSKIEGSQMTTMDCVDRGRTRSVADQLKIQHGLKLGTHIAQVASAIAGLCHERIRRLSVGQTLEIYNGFKVPVNFIIANRSKLPGLKSSGVLAGFAFVLASTEEVIEINKRPEARMFYALNAGEELERYPMIKQLHEFLISEKAGFILKNMNRSVAELTVQAIWQEVRIAARKQAPAKLELGMDGVKHYRAAQPERTGTVAMMFKLPEGGKLGLAVPRDANGKANYDCKCGQAGKIRIDANTMQCIRCYVKSK